jgi:hypothetical protein
MNQSFASAREAFEYLPYLYETDLINIFKSFNLKILNDKNKQPSIYTIKYLTFLK